VTDERRKAIEAVWRTLKNPLCMMSRPDRDEVMKLAREHELTVSELLEYVYKERRNA
jgi:hypothetical protein